MSVDAATSSLDRPTRDHLEHPDQSKKCDFRQESDAHNRNYEKRLARCLLVHDMPRILAKPRSLEL